ncbi:tol-pal system-associated acyl-CoA thioesterase [Roseovarius salinarum]|uniref:tol-pal system-associated acyl-CoA thioesterase n=1 Tax=Roseovarius salinarum TaxID=1981892 RepID=UPI000C341B74|nr:tol-pal system-associated acyl-CoA thioesterase [Roseovarius salinarum]
MTHRFELRVHYEDTDMGGIVYHANYLKFIERARSDWVRGLGVDQRAMRDGDGLVFAVRRIVADYLAPAHFDEVLQVETFLRSLSGARLDLGQTVSRGTDRLFAAEVTVVCLAASGRPVRLPANIRRLLARGG